LAGLGGETIIEILKAHPRKLEKVTTIIVDAHSQVKEVREYLSKIGFIIADERMIKEDEIYYEIIRFIRADIAFYSEEDLTYGPILRCNKNNVFKEKYISRINEIERILKKKNIPASRLAELQKEKERLLGVV